MGKMCRSALILILQALQRLGPYYTHIVMCLYAPVVTIHGVFCKISYLTIRVPLCSDMLSPDLQSKKHGLRAEVGQQEVITNADSLLSFAPAHHLWLQARLLFEAKRKGAKSVRGFRCSVNRERVGFRHLETHDP